MFDGIVLREQFLNALCDIFLRVMERDDYRNAYHEIFILWPRLGNKARFYDLGSNTTSLNLTLRRPDEKQNIPIMSKHRRLRPCSREYLCRCRVLSMNIQRSEILGNL